VLALLNKRKGATGFGPVAPNLNVVNVLTPPTTLMEGFTNHLVVLDYIE
jgi:hypothetical protein